MDLHKEFVKVSFDIIRMKNKLISLLLEIYEKEIYRKHGCRTIFEYGFKYAKLSKEVIEKALRTLKHVEDKPFLKKMIETQGIHKVSMVATIATPKTDKMFVQHVENMSKPALFEFAKEIRHREKQDGSDTESLFDEQNNTVQKCQAAPGKITIDLDQESQILFLRLKNKYAKNVSNKEALKVLLKKLEIETKNAKNTPLRPPSARLRSVFSVPGNGIRKHEKMAEAKRKTDEISEKKFATDIESQNIPQIAQLSEEPVFPTRYIPAKLKKEILEKYNHKCAYPGCVKPAEHFHHRTAFGFEKNHESIIPLCEIHHQFAHNGIIKHESKEPKDWQLNVVGEKTFYDQMYLKYRNPKKQTAKPTPGDPAPTALHKPISTI